ncbi:hypothetical protein Tco_0955454 [Tanacetum coccineum]|uniref:Zf-CCHC domain-containing protein/DUF4219 domain-containing protein/UBN2 domain-containing protein n=1 Tax=Tanacetum coccineum TaxID=301880 RepID=A0ABQ5E787_9ASTR
MIMDSENYKEGQSMQRPPLFEANCFIYWKNRFETYVKSKDIDLWHIIVYGDYKPTIKNKDTGKEEVIPYKKFEEIYKKMISKNDEAKMVLYNALPKKEYERIFMCKTAKDVWNSLIITHQALDESFSSRNYVRKFLRALPTKWRPKVTTIKEYKELSTLPLDEVVDNLKVYEVRKVSSDEDESYSGSNEEYAMAVRDFKKLFRRREKFVRQSYDDKQNLRKVKEEKKGKEERRCFKCGDPSCWLTISPEARFPTDSKPHVKDILRLTFSLMCGLQNLSLDGLPSCKSWVLTKHVSYFASFLESLLQSPLTSLSLKILDFYKEELVYLEFAEVFVLYDLAFLDSNS